MASVNIALQNQTTSGTVYAYITGQAIDNNNALFLLQSDGKTPYYPSSPSAPGSALAQDCAIPLGAPGNTVTVTVPHLAGSRIWFSVNTPLTFLLNPGPGLVEPSVNNPSDPNINTTWDFCEFTFNSFQIFANITYVDFVCLPISLSLTSTSSGNTQHIAGMAPSGLDTVCNALRAQGGDWASLVVPSPSGGNLRALSSNNGIVVDPNRFRGYYDPYVSAVWSAYTNQDLSIDTQAQWGTVTGRVDPSTDLLTFPGVGTFARPSTADIFSCSTGPFAASQTNTVEMGALTARICAAFNRSTLLTDGNVEPSTDVSKYYQNEITNHYSRIVHAANLDGLGYAFPYDDVSPTGGRDQSGAVHDPNPLLLTVAVGGGNATAALTTQ